MDELDRRITTCEERITALENGQNHINIELAKISILIENVQRSIDELKTDMNELKAKPSKKWDIVITAAITAIVSGLVTLMLTKLI